MPLTECKLGAAAAVSDLDRATEFYEGVLGLEPGDLPQEMADHARVYACGGETTLFVYRSDHAGTNKATLAGFEVDDFSAIHSELSERGVMFERYDEEDMKTDADGVIEAGTYKVAFFKDPDGNTFSINGS